MELQNVDRRLDEAMSPQVRVSHVVWRASVIGGIALEARRPVVIARRSILGLLGGSAVAAIVSVLDPLPARAQIQAVAQGNSPTALAAAEYRKVMESTQGLKGGRCFIKRISDTSWEVGYQMDRVRWAVYTLKAPEVPGPRAAYDRVPQLHTAYIRMPRSRHRCKDRARWKYSKAWKVQTSYGYLRALPGAPSAAYALPPGSRSVCLHTASHVANGLVRVRLTDERGKSVTLTGAKKGRDLMAAGVVSRASMASGAVTSGSRYVDTYEPGSQNGREQVKMLAENLDPARKYTLKVWPVNVKLKGRTNKYAGIFGASVETQKPNSGTHWVTVERMGTSWRSHSAHEYALNVGIGGRDVFIGGVHGYDAPVSLAVYVDGQRKSQIPNGKTYVGTSIRLERKTRLEHPGVRDNGKAADALVRYSMTRWGLKVNRTVRWAVKGTYKRPYFVMWPTSLERVTWIGADRNWDADRNLGKGAKAHLGFQKSLTCVAWNPGSKHIGVCDYSLDSVAGWQWGTEKKPQVYYEDRSSGIKKLYVCPLPAGTNRSFKAGETFRAESTYRMGRVPSADSLLNRG
ncbi:hypothetical protein [Arthrobacter sulfonylureivorans]|uniref:Uncharacterized protein n=1 Tax=Arthrobacter sulfonylureivorans TaxID=2486855 RepID=A0ABY3WAJ5_9MICC|nr:hypothetical protein [Arthrobacter sulfonylureivorans]UNK47367.1 hypothetical protein MNQ99_08575 [Arthrobacter sulfonylureivorans]